MSTLNFHWVEATFPDLSCTERVASCEPWVRAIGIFTETLLKLVSMDPLQVLPSTVKSALAIPELSVAYAANTGVAVVTVMVGEALVITGGVKSDVVEPVSRATVIETKKPMRKIVRITLRGNLVCAFIFAHSFQYLSWLSLQKY